MKKILIVSATLKSNFELSKELSKICLQLGSETQIISLENANQELKIESQKRLNRDLSE